MKLLTVVGARPQFIKAAVLSRALRSYPSVSEFILHTGQHYDDNMSAVFFSELGLSAADMNLGIQEETATEALAKMISETGKVIRKQSPDLVLVYGDTYSTLAGALAARMCGVEVAHVEAGMRHGHHFITEEMNRVLTDRLSTYLFCSSENAMRNLDREGFTDSGSRRFLCGDLMIDAAMHYAAMAEKRESRIPYQSGTEYILCTLHRAENVDDRDSLTSLLSAIDQASEIFPVILPLHPRTRKRMQSFGLKTRAEIIDPVGYPDMLRLLMDCKLVMTDSGGLQKEAYYFKKPTVLLREFTEWKELEDNSYLICAGISKERIIPAMKSLLGYNLTFSENFYGRGDAGNKIASVLEKLLSTAFRHKTS